MQIAPTFVFRGLQSPVYSLTLSSDAETTFGTLYSGDRQGGITSFDLGTRREVKRWSGFHKDSVMSLWMNDGKMCSQGRDGLVKTWSIEEGKILSEIATGTTNFCKASFLASSSLSPSPMAACTTASAREVKIWDLNSSEVICTLDQFQDRLGMVMSVQFLSGSSFDTHACIGYENGGVYFWDLKMNKVAFELPKKLPEAILSTAFNSKATEGICGGAASEVMKFKVLWSKKEVQEAQTAELPQQGINELGVRIDGKIAVGAGWDHRIRIWQWKNMKPLGVLKYHSEGVSSVVFSRIDNLIVSGGQDSKIALWNIY